MKRSIRVIIKQIVCILLILSLSGCWSRRELDDLAIVVGTGIDTSEAKENQVQVTVQLVKPVSVSAGGGGGGKPFWNAVNTDKTIFSVVRGMTGKCSRRLFFPHNQVLIIGRKAAESGIQKYLDCFERDHEMRNNVLLVISETTAQEILNVESELEVIPALKVSELINQYAKSTSKAPVIQVSDYSMRYLSGTTGPIAPMVKVVPNNGEEVVEVSGTAVFKEDKMVGQLNQSEGRGLLWVIGDIKSGAIVVDDQQGDPVAIEIIRAKAKIKPVLENGTITIKVEVFEEGNVAEITGTEKLSEMANVVYLEEKIDQAIESEIQAAIQKSRELGVDIFGFGEAVRGKYPSEYKEMEDNWEEIYKTLKVELTIDSNLRLMGKTVDPLIPKEGRCQ